MLSNIFFSVFKYILLLEVFKWPKVANTFLAGRILTSPALQLFSSLEGEGSVGSPVYVFCFISHFRHTPGKLPTSKLGDWLGEGGAQCDRVEKLIVVKYAFPPCTSYSANTQASHLQFVHTLKRTHQLRLLSRCQQPVPGHRVWGYIQACVLVISFFITGTKMLSGGTIFDFLIDVQNFDLIHTAAFLTSGVL